MSSEYKIEKNVPLSPRSWKGKPKYPWAQMDPGDSFVVPGEGRTLKVLQTTILTSARRHKPKRFSTRIEGGNVRVWRTA